MAGLLRRKRPYKGKRLRGARRRRASLSAQARVKNSIVHERASHASHDQRKRDSSRRSGSAFWSCGNQWRYQAAARGAGSTGDGQWCPDHRRRQARALLGNHQDRSDLRQWRGDPPNFLGCAGTASVPHQRADKKGSGLPGSEVEELQKCKRVCGIGVYRAGGRFLGHALPGGPHRSPSPGCASRDSTCRGEFSNTCATGCRRRRA